MLKKIIGAAGCIALTLSFTGCPAEESKTPDATDATKAADDAKADGEKAADDATKAADDAKKGE